jgi:hypothetical protein
MPEIEHNTGFSLLPHRAKISSRIKSRLQGACIFMVSQDLLEILRCPVAVHYTDKGSDPGRLELVHGCWLVCADSGYKYPIIDDIPVLLVEVGEKYKGINVKDLPVPPPSDI